jgi:uncharacterized protein YbjT (DUF2867 family)
MRRACTGADRAFLLTNSTERAQAQQTTFARIARQSGVRHVVKLSQLHADARSPAASSAITPPPKPPSARPA